jgi:type II secretion system protein D
MLMSQIARGPNAPRIVANLESNALLILATPADLAVIDEMIRAIDSEGSEFRKTHVYPLEHADAATVLQSVREMVGPNARVSAHFGSNSIVITDTEANVARAFDLIQKLDEASQMEDVVTQVVPLENSNASVLVEPLTNIVNQVNSVVGQGNKPEVQVYPEIEANTIVIIGASEDVAQLERIVTELDQEAVLDREPAVFFLEKANATEIAREIQQLYTGISNRVPPRIVANTWANAIMVFADPQDTQIIGDLVSDLDQSEGRRRVVEIFELQNSDASVMAAKIAELFQYGGVDPRTSRSSRSYRYSSYGGSGRRDEGLTEGMVAVIPDLRLNALIVTAEPQDIDQVAKIIETLDVEGTHTSEPRVFQLENAEAEALAETLEQLFAEFDYTQGYYYSDSREVGVSDLSGKVRIIPDSTTNSLIVLSSSPKAFDVVAEMIAELDKPSIQEARTQIIKVNHADVVALAKTLTTIFKKDEGADERRNFFFSDFFGGSGGGGAGSSYSNLIGKVRIEPDTRTSSLLVVTPEVFFPSVAKIVETLDIPTKQIMLEVLIAELTRNNERDLGLQWGVDPQTGEIGQISVNNQEIFNYDTDRDDYINPFASPTDYVSGHSLSDPAQFITLNNTQFNVVLNFLQSCRDISIKQRPRVTAADNLPALIRVGSETPFISSIDQSAGQTTTAVEYRPLGLTLEVTPHINSATEVTLDISVQDGAIDSSVSPLAGLAFTFTDREINTKAVVRDRHTVVLGGVIVERDRVQIDDVPVLNRLPVVGKRLFSNENTVTETVELLTFITPYILNDSRDAKLATEMVQQESQNYSLREMDLENGKWPEEYADKNQKGPWEE